MSLIEAPKGGVIEWEYLLVSWMLKALIGKPWIEETTNGLAKSRPSEFHYKSPYVGDSLF